MLGVAAAFAATLAPAAAHAAVGLSVTGDDGNPVPLGGALNIRNMNPALGISSTTTDHFNLSVTGPNGAKVTSDLDCFTNYTTNQKPIDYVGNGTYTVTLTTFGASDSFCTGAGTTQSLAFSITASTAFGPVPAAVLTRPPGGVVPNTVPIGIDLNPGALSTDVFYERGAPPNPDGSLPGAVAQALPDTAARTVGIRLDKGPGIYYMAAHAKAFTGIFAPWAAPAAIRTFAPFDLQKFRWTDSRGPSYRFSATVRATGADGRVNLAIARGSKGKYHSLGTAKIRKHKFSKRFRLTKLGKYRIRFKYKGNSTVAPGYEVHRFEITRRVVFRGAAAGGSSVVARGSSLSR